jgi:hypothetical protein
VQSCEASGNSEWSRKHRERIETLVQKHFPSGSGFDVGTGIDLDASSEEKLVLHTSFHHMNEGGMYDGWTDHIIRVYPSLAFGFRTTISGRDRNQIKEYMGECFCNALSAEVTDAEQGKVTHA